MIEGFIDQLATVHPTAMHARGRAQDALPLAEAATVLLFPSVVVDAASADAASVDAASVDAASVDAASVDAASVDAASVHAVVVKVDSALVDAPSVHAVVVKVDSALVVTLSGQHKYVSYNSWQGS